MRRLSVEPDESEMPAMQVEAKARQQHQVQPNGRRGQYDDCKLLQGVPCSCLCVTENVSSLVSAQTIAGAVISFLSDICNPVGIRSPGHGSHSVLRANTTTEISCIKLHAHYRVLPRTLVLQHRRDKSLPRCRGLWSDICNPGAFEAPDASPLREPGIACATLRVFQAHDVSSITKVATPCPTLPKPKASEITAA